MRVIPAARLLLGFAAVAAIALLAFVGTHHATMQTTMRHTKAGVGQDLGAQDRSARPYAAGSTTAGAILGADTDPDQAFAQAVDRAATLLKLVVVDAKSGVAAPPCASLTARELTEPGPARSARAGQDGTPGTAAALPPRLHGLIVESAAVSAQWLDYGSNFGLLTAGGACSGAPSAEQAV